MLSPDTRSELAPAVALFRPLADPTRLAILRRLTAGEARVIALSAPLGPAQSTVSEDLACLCDGGLVGSRPVRRASVHFVTRPALFDLLEAAAVLLAISGDAVAPCPNYRGAT